jgi:hypothetical protein
MLEGPCRGQAGPVPGRTKMAEREGFEPSVEVSPHTRLAGEHLQPLGHLSDWWREPDQNQLPQPKLTLITSFYQPRNLPVTTG